MQELGPAFDVLSRARIYFGHHSVGDDLLRGMGLLAARIGCAPLRVLTVEEGRVDPTGASYFAEGRVGRNEDPGGKLADFEAQAAGLPEDLDAAMMKFCYVDFSPETDVESLFVDYWEAMGRIEASRPGLRLFHCTVPLMVRDNSFSNRLRGLLGRTPYRDLANARRDDWNRAMRVRCPADRLIDVAEAESTDEIGRAVVSDVEGVARPSLLPAYARDAGHLNDVGAERIAAEMLRTLGAGLNDARE